MTTEYSWRGAPLHGDHSSPFTSEQWRALAAAMSLSPRQLELLRAICDDLKESTIALRMGISVHTVHSHREKLYGKLDVHNRTALLVRVWREAAALTARSPAFAQAAGANTGTVVPPTVNTLASDSGGGAKSKARTKR